MSVKIYAAHAMTGRTGEEIVEESAWILNIFKSYGIEVLDPVTAEDVKPTRKKINSPYKVLDEYWKRDKEMIREANVLVDFSPDRKSEGVSHEIGYARYCWWKPVVRVYPKGKIPSNLSVAYFEDDVITDSGEEAALIIKQKFGTKIKRAIWRYNMLKRSLPKWILQQIKEWFI